MTIDVETLRRLAPLLDRVLDRDESERAAWLNGLAGDDAELATMLHPLLQANLLLAAYRVFAVNGTRQEHPEVWTRIVALVDPDRETSLSPVVRAQALLQEAEILLRENEPEAALVKLQQIGSALDAENRSNRGLLDRLHLRQGLANQALGRHEPGPQDRPVPVRLAETGRV